MRKIAPVARPQVGEQIDPVQMEILLAGINIIAERLCHGVGGYIEIHPADKIRFVRLRFSGGLAGILPAETGHQHQLTKSAAMAQISRAMITELRFKTDPSCAIVANFA